MSTNKEKIAQLLALTALIGVILAPPEVFGSGRMILILASTFAFLILVLEGRIPSGFLWAGLGGTALLLWHSIWISIDVYRSLEFLEILWAYYCLFGVFFYSHREYRYWTAATLILLSVAVSGYGVYEFFWGSSGYSLSISADSGEVLRTPLQGDSETVRIISTFAMPGTLWGFLLVALPIHALAWKPGRTLVNAGLVASALLLIGAGGLTRSYGFALGLLVLGLAWFVVRPGRRRWRLTALALLFLVLLTAGIYSGRSGNYNPVTLRFQNWLTAAEIFGAYPLGAGLHTYAVAYLQHQQPGANESQYAHNTPLQVLSELGVLGIVAGIFLIVYLVKHRDTWARVIDEQRCLALALIGWTLHNLIDINLYFASVGAVGIALIGVLGSTMRRDSPPRAIPVSKWWIRGVGVVSVFVILSSGVIYVSDELLRRARIERGYLRVAEAHDTLGTASAINPFNSSILHGAGQVALEMYQTTRQEEYLEQSQRYFADAVRLSPKKVGPHLGLALSISSANELGEALEELEIAQTMHPYSRHVSNIRRLIENRQAEPADATDPVPEEPEPDSNRDPGEP